MVVRQIAPDQKRAYRRSLYRAVRGSGVSAEPWVMSEEEYEESKTVIGSLAYPAWSEGVLLYENA